MITIMRVADVLDLPSVEWGLADYAIPGATVREILEGPEFFLEGYHEGIKKLMRIDGINAVPIHVAELDQLACDYNDAELGFLPYPGKGMGNGHHRLAIARELGHKYIKTSDDIMQTGEADDEVMSNDEWEKVYGNDYSEDETSLHSKPT